MRKFIGTVVILLAIVAVFGWYRGWFTFNVEKQDGKTDMNISVDKKKIQEDAKEAEKAFEKGVQK